MNESSPFTSRQLLFKELFAGTLICAVVLGFFDDDASIVTAKSFSYVFWAAIVLEVLTCVALAVKDATVVRRLADDVFVRLGRSSTPARLVTDGS